MPQSSSAVNEMLGTDSGGTDSRLTQHPPGFRKPTLHLGRIAAYFWDYANTTAPCPLVARCRDLCGRAGRARLGLTTHACKPTFWVWFQPAEIIGEMQFGKHLARRSLRCVVMMKLSVLTIAGVISMSTPMWAQADPGALRKAEKVSQTWTGTLVDADCKAAVSRMACTITVSTNQFGL